MPAVEMDIRDVSGAEDVLSRSRPDAIVHLDGRAGVRPSIEDPGPYSDVKPTGTVRWLEAVARLEPRPRFVYASGSSVHGHRPDAPFREAGSVDLPIGPPSATKNACEPFAFTFHHVRGPPVPWLRFFIAYGPRNHPDLAIAEFTLLIDRGEPVPMSGDCTTRRDYIFVGNIVDGIVRAADDCRGHHLYNLGNSDPIELRQLIDAIAVALSKTSDIRRRRPRDPGGRPNVRAKPYRWS
jgi:UDP-glucuronate 4-epimerase